MSIERVEFDEGPVVLRCDSCPEYIEFSSFKKAVAFKRKQREREGGWRSYKDGDEWKDSCPACTEEFLAHL